MYQKYVPITSVYVRSFPTRVHVLLGKGERVVVKIEQRKGEGE